jgi:hypothetical protein
LQAPVPPGALPQEKADNVPAKLSQGEYVLPAEVVRWHGVKAIQDMMSAAQEGFGKLQQQGQIKGQQQMPPQSPNAGQGQPRPQMQQPPTQKPQMPTQRPPSPISGMADGGMVSGKASPFLRPLAKGERRDNGDGTHSTELTVTVPVDGRWMNVPSLWNDAGKYVELDEESAVGAAKRYMKATGKAFPSYETVEDAVNAARSRSESGGAGSGPLEQKFADGGMVAGGAPAGVRLEQRTLPDGRMIYVYVDASGNPIGQLGSQFLGQNQAPQTESRVSDTVVPVSNNSITNPTNNTNNSNSNSPVRFAGSDAPGTDADQGGPTNAADDENASPMDAVGAMAAAIGRGLMGAVMGPIAEAEVVSGQFGAKMRGHVSNDIVDAVEAAYDVSDVTGSPAADGKGVAGGGGTSASSTDGSPAGDGGGVAGGGTGSSGGTEGSPAGDGGGTAGGAGAGSSGSGMGADPDGGDAYADGGMVCPPGLHMKAKSKPKGKSAPWLK